MRVAPLEYLILDPRKWASKVQVFISRLYAMAINYVRLMKHANISTAQFSYSTKNKSLYQYMDERVRRILVDEFKNFSLV